MPLSVEQLTKQAMQLPPACRAKLAEMIIDSVDPINQSEIDHLWAIEAKRRCDDVRRGLVKMIPGPEALAQVRQLVGRKAK